LGSFHSIRVGVRVRAGAGVRVIAEVRILLVLGDELSDVPHSVLQDEAAVEEVPDIEISPY